MGELTAIEIKAFVPARDFELSKQFYRDLGFVAAWSDEQLTYFRCGECSFLSNPSIERNTPATL